MGVYLSQPNKEKGIKSGEGPNFSFVVSDMQGWRKTMEDSFIADTKSLGDETSIFGVFDGHGGSKISNYFIGKEVAKFVESHFIDELKKSKFFEKKEFEAALKETFLKLDELLDFPESKKELYSYRFPNDEDKSDNMLNGKYIYNVSECLAGCTANVAIIHKNKLIVANAGDSRCLLVKENGVEEMSLDHKPDNEKEKERIVKAGGIVANGRINMNLNLSRAIGDLEYKRNNYLQPNEQLIISEPDIKVKELEKTDKFILMGCDGIWETMTQEEIVSFIRSKINEKVDNKDIIQQFLDQAIAPNTATGLGCDNMTSILIVFNNDAK